MTGSSLLLRLQGGTDLGPNRCPSSIQCRTRELRVRIDLTGRDHTVTVYGLCHPPMLHYPERTDWGIRLPLAAGTIVFDLTPTGDKPLRSDSTSTSSRTISFAPLPRSGHVHIVKKA